jgi:hypothetical protein
MELRGWSDKTRRSQFFTALASCDDDGPFRPGGPRVLVTLRPAGDDVADCLGIGHHFGLRFGTEVGKRVVTRRLFV